MTMRNAKQYAIAIIIGLLIALLCIHIPSMADTFSNEEQFENPYTIDENGDLSVDDAIIENTDFQIQR